VFDLSQLRHPIVQAPMGGGPSTPELAAAVSNAGGLGFLAAGYRTPDDFQSEIAALRRLTPGPFGVNLFHLTEPTVDDDSLARYAAALERESTMRGVALGRPRFDDDCFDAKLEVVLSSRPPVASFTFGCPGADLVHSLHERGIAAWVTITEVPEAQQAVAAGADALIVQGVEAGGHRGTFDDIDGWGEVSLLPLLRLVARASDLPLIASGGIADGAGVAAALVAGAHAVQIGTAFMRCPEAGTSKTHRATLASAAPTALTRAFTGRRARGIVNSFMRDYEGSAPAAYPHVHHLTAPLRAAARAAEDAEGINLWAGEAHELAEALPAAELVARLVEDAGAALAAGTQRLDDSPKNP
jgi:nitronate monooxygenase